MNIQKNDGIYLYCVIPENNELKINCKGMEEQDIYTIEYNNIMAVVSNSPYKVYDLFPENLLVHENVLKEIMDGNDVLPFNFGNVLKTKDDLIKFLDKTYDYIIRIFKRVSGKVEIGLRIFIKSRYFNEEIENNDIKKMKIEIEKVNPKANQLLKVELGKLVKKSVEDKQAEISNKIFKILKQYSSEAKENASSTVNMVLNAAFLIEKDKLQLFTEKLNEISPPFDEKYTFKLTGPWPPYNFIDLPK